MDPARAHPAAVSAVYSRTASTAPGMFATIAPFHSTPELLMIVVTSLPGAVENMYWAPGPDTTAGACSRFRSSNSRTPTSSSRSRAVVCRCSGAVRSTRPVPTAFDVISGAPSPEVARTRAATGATGLYVNGASVYAVLSDSHLEVVARREAPPSRTPRSTSSALVAWVTLTTSVPPARTHDWRSRRRPASMTTSPMSTRTLYRRRALAGAVLSITSKESPQRVNGIGSYGLGSPPEVRKRWEPARGENGAPGVGPGRPWCG